MQAEIQGVCAGRCFGGLEGNGRPQSTLTIPALTVSIFYHSILIGDARVDALERMTNKKERQAAEHLPLSDPRAGRH